MSINILMRRMLAAAALLALLSFAPHVRAQVQPINCQPNNPCTPLGPTFTQSGDTYYSAWGKQNQMNQQLFSAFGNGSNLQVNGSVSASDVAKLFGTPTSGQCLGSLGVLVSCGGGGGSPGGSTGQIQYNNSGAFGGLATTGSGNAVLATGAAMTSPTITSATMITPALGVIASGTLTNAIGLPLSTGVTGTLQAAQMPALTGDVSNTAGSLSTTVIKINGGSLPASATVLGSNGSSQPISTSTTGTGAVLLASSVPVPSGGLTAAGCSNSTLVGGANATTLIAAASMVAGATGSCSLVLTLPSAAGGWQCDGVDTTGHIVFAQTAESTTSCTLSAAATSGDTMIVKAIGLP